MPWYWTDDLARVLRELGSVPEEVASKLRFIPVAIWREESTIEAAALAMIEDDEIPLAA